MSIVICLYGWSDAGYDPVEVTQRLANFARKFGDVFDARTTAAPGRAEKSEPVRVALERFFAGKRHTLFSDAARICVEGANNPHLKYLFVLLKDAYGVLDLDPGLDAFGLPAAYGFVEDRAGLDFPEDQFANFGLGITHFCEDDLLDLRPESLIAPRPWDAWAEDISGRQSFRGGALRDIYPINILNSRHLENWGVERDKSLVELCDAGRFGRIVPIGDELFSWIVEPDIRASVEAYAQASGKIIASARV